MNRRKKLLLASFSALGLALVALLIWRSEPRYGGRTLTDWAIDAHDYEQLRLSDRPTFLSASNAIYRMGPAAAKRALDWLESDARWEASKLRPWVEKYRVLDSQNQSVDRSHLIPIILRLVGAEGRQHVGSRLSSFLSSSITSDSMSAHELDIAAKSWPKTEPLLVQINQETMRRLRWRGRETPKGERVDTDSLWIARSRDNNVQSRGYVEELLLKRGADTNRLAEAIGNDFLSAPDRRGNRYDAIRMAFSLLKLGTNGQAYLKAGLTNNARDVIEASTRAMSMSD